MIRKKVEEKYGYVDCNEDGLFTEGGKRIMERLTHQTRWTNDIDLKQEYGYKHIYQRLCEYENTGLTPEKVEQLQTENKELKELLVMAIADISAVNNCELCCFYDNDNNICTNLDSHCYKGNGFKWQHQDRLDKLLQEASE